MPVLVVVTDAFFNLFFRENSSSSRCQFILHRSIKLCMQIKKFDNQIGMTSRTNTSTPGNDQTRTVMLPFAPGEFVYLV